MNSTDCRHDADTLRTVARGDRFRPYRHAHQQLRIALGNALQRCIRMAAGDLTCCSQLAGEIEAMLDLHAAHQAAEDQCLHAPLRERAPRALLAFDAEHEDQLGALATLRPLLRELRSNPPHAAALAAELELRLSLFIAEALAHMADEETTLTRVLWQHFTDAQLREFAVPLHAIATKEDP
jgi:hypothetical protein